MMRSRLAAIPIACLLAGGWAHATDAPPRVVEFKSDRITVHAEQVPVGDILDEIKRQSGADIRGDAPRERQVSTTFDKLPTQEALERLLGAQNFALTYGAEGNLVLIDLKGAPEEKRALPATAAAAPEDGGPRTASDYAPQGWWDMRRAFDDRGKEIPVSGALAKLLGSDKTSFEILVQAAYGLDDPALRAEARRASLRALERDPALRDALLQGLAAMDDGALATYARAACRDRALEFMKGLARDTENPDLRARARAIMRRVRDQEHAAVRLNLEG